MKKSTHKKADHYNDPNHNYLHYWHGRDYEHAAEEIAIARLLNGRHFEHAVDVGGGFGRLCVFLKDYARTVTLAEPSQQQLDIAADFLKDEPTIECKLLQADDLQFADGTIDLLTMVRVMHHLPDPKAEFAEIHRVLSDDGYFILEMANYAHGRNRLRHLMSGKPLPTEPVDIRSAHHRDKDSIAFVNHNPKTVKKQLSAAGFVVEKTLSVSNLRSTTLKKLLPKSLMLRAEKVLQPALASTFFGPSIFFLVRKAN